ncbi:hypothetical protein G7Y89_g8496 [Cudoniella acicularis]|uniref:2EXR domain-containing protein n=1 Tax=Cudoniella acicularis TaxID=354080 RepID=A0A8H4W0K3_9HELO|nr:hypothetical protein G7Y89_g8496 [Cudoniella acicularis]
MGHKTSSQAFELHASRPIEFSDLPAELRQMIWTYAHSPRDIIISLPRFQSKKTYASPLGYVTMTSPCAHLLVNHEARATFLAHYLRLFKNYPKGKGWYFNPEKDTLCLRSGRRGLKDLLEKYFEDMKKIRYLDIHPDNNVNFSRAHHARDFIFGPLCTLRLQELTQFNLKRILIRPLPANNTVKLGEYGVPGRLWPYMSISTTRTIYSVFLHEKRSLCPEQKCPKLALRMYCQDSETYLEDLFCEKCSGITKVSSRKFPFHFTSHTSHPTDDGQFIEDWSVTEGQLWDLGFVRCGTKEINLHVPN